MENPNLPEEMLIEIFSRLPTKSVGICRCLSKSWRARLSNSKFLNLHFTKKTYQEKLILLSKTFNDIQKKLDHHTHIISSPVTHDPVVPEKLDMPNTWDKVLGSCNGLVLMLDSDKCMFLVNPVTKEQLHIPKPSFDPSGFFPFCDNMYGLGYDSSSDDYKIVIIEVSGGMYVDVYSVKDGLWIRNHTLGSRFDITDGAPGALVNGALHWVARDCHSGEPRILAFDLASEEFREIPVPTSADGAGLASRSDAFVLEGCLCIVPEHDVDAWIMKEYGLRESWTHVSLDRSGHQLCSPKPLCYIGEGDDEVLLVIPTMGLLAVFNFKEKSLKEMLVNGDMGLFLDGSMFVESLVSPHKLASCS